MPVTLPDPEHLLLQVTDARGGPEKYTLAGSEELLVDVRPHAAILVRALKAAGGRGDELRLNHCDLRSMILDGGGSTLSKLYVANSLVDGLVLLNWNITFSNRLHTLNNSESIRFEDCRLSGQLLQDCLVSMERCDCHDLKLQLLRSRPPVALRCTKTNLTDVELTNAEDGCQFFFRSCLGLWGSHCLKFDQLPAHEETATVVNGWGLRWDQLKLVGQHRVIGSASYASLIVLVLYGNGLNWLNIHLSGFVGQDDLVIRNVPPPSLSGWLLVALFLLGLGSTFYNWKCPSIVKESSEHSWQRLQEESFIEYRAASVHDLKWRWITTVMYILGGGFTGLYLAWRALRALQYYWTL